MPSNPTNDLFARLESIQFSVELGVSSSFTTFLAILTQHPDYLLLQQVAEENPDLIVERMLRNASYSFDHRYQNPYDTVMAAYYHALRHHSISFYSNKAERILGYMDNVCWSAKVIQPQPIINVSKERLGWKYWPTVLSYHAYYILRGWWRNLFNG